MAVAGRTDTRPSVQIPTYQQRVLERLDCTRRTERYRRFNQYCQEQSAVDPLAELLVRNYLRCFFHVAELCVLGKYRR